jgi:radical SAM protein with 4Fe4S-binding SPASM domain
MKNLLHQAGWRIYRAVHSNGLLADAVYTLAYHWQKVTRRFAYWRAARHHVTPDELWQYRHLQVGGALQTGVTNICNAKCSFCAYPKVVANKTLQTGIMSFVVFKQAVDEWAALGGHSLDLTPVVGDPLVDPGLLEKVDYAVHQARIKTVMLTTNAILLNRNDTYKRLIDLGIGAVFISTQGTSKEAYEKVYGVKHYPEVISGLRNLLEYNRQKGEPAAIVIRFRNAEKPSQIVRSPDFIKHIKPFLSAKVRINFTVDFDNWGGTIKPEDVSGFMKLRQLPPALDLPCQALFGFVVRHDGNVRLCGCRLVTSDMDDLVVGNIRNKSLQEISSSPEAWAIIKGFYSGQRPQTCRECTFYRPINRSWFEHRAAQNAAGPINHPPLVDGGETLTAKQVHLVR